MTRTYKDENNMKHSLSFDDTETAFMLKSDSDLKKANLIFKLIGNQRITRIAKPVTDFLFKIKFPLAPILRETIFRHFCGGESIAGCDDKIENLYSKGNVFSILDYSVEGKETEKQFDKTLDTILRVCDYAKSKAVTPFLVFKGTGLGRFKLFEKMSNDETLNDVEKKEWDKVVSRFDRICRKVSTSNNLKVMIDAEESWIQDAIDKLTEDMMEKYNTERAVVFNTVQMYRWDRLDYLKYLQEKAVKLEFSVGVKLVRGAYMEKERKRAKVNEYISPICKNKEVTDTNFDDGIYFCLKNLELFEIFMGTHNENNSKLLPGLMKNSGLKNNDSRIWFGQLYGMSDHISFNLAKNGYNVAKYLPFGPIREVIPYLIRRAEENTSVGSQTSKELLSIKKEIARRKRKSFQNI